MGDVVDLNETRRERTARDVRDQVDRAEFYRRTFLSALVEIRLIVATGHSAPDQVEAIDDIAKRAMEARW